MFFSISHFIPIVVHHGLVMSLSVFTACFIIIDFTYSLFFVINTFLSSHPVTVCYEKVHSIVHFYICLDSE